MQRPRLLHGWGLGLGLLLSLLCALGAAARADAQDTLSQSQVEAVYLFKFASFVTWPETAFASPGSALVVGVVDDANLARELARVAEGKRVGGRALQVRIVEDEDELDGLHVLFIGARARDRTEALVEALADRPVLTVSDHPAVHARGTMVNFVVVDQRVRFDVAVGPVRRSSLHMSALMMTAAREVARAGT